MSRAPTVKKGPASHYAMAGETIMEIHSSALRCGCLISIREHAGRLIVETYRADKSVRVRINGRDFKAPN